ncbi:ATP-binding cassette, sub-B (MDR TAP), member 4, partial [Cladochytrium tenue]
ENVMFGLPGYDGSLQPQSTDDAVTVDKRIEMACKAANAWDFILDLPDGILTQVGEQRIAIARAIIGSPAFLLLDEATSALDSASEREVQHALDLASQNRTTIAVAHRLSTVRNADLIVVMAQGEIVESGTHGSLMRIPGGIYARMASAQSLAPDQNAEPRDTADTVAAAVAHTYTGEWNREADHKDSNPTKTIDINVVAEEFKDVAKPLVAADDIEAAADAEKKGKADWARLSRLAAPHWPLYAVGAIFNVLIGAIFPVFALALTSILADLGIVDDNTRASHVSVWCLVFVGVAVGAFASQAAGSLALAVAGERLASDVRKSSFRRLLALDPAFHDRDENSSAALAARLAEDARQVKELVGNSVAAVIQASSTLICGIAISFSAGPLLALIVLCLLPVMVLGEFLEVKVNADVGGKTQELYEESAIIANEAISNITTVMTLTKERAFMISYNRRVQQSLRLSVNGAFTGGFGYAASQSILFFALATMFYAGSSLATAGKMPTENILKVIFELAFSAVALANAAGAAPDIASARVAAANVFRILDKRPAIDPDNEDGFRTSDPTGSASVNDVFFQYPTRSNVPVLQGLTVAVQPGETVALVGKSGCGKSTVIGLLLRHYDPSTGTASFDDHATTEWNVTDLRSHMATVGQEPVLFNVSIRENIACGATEAVHDVPMTDIVAAARLANIHDFVASLPQGYDTVVGAKGGQLSGGQKQRVAIARALIRNPKLLLLDEATSALDSQSETVVQEALDRASHGRSTIVIAHRLSTIRNADRIYVVDAGRVAESGTFDELGLNSDSAAHLLVAE